MTTNKPARLLRHASGTPVIRPASVADHHQLLHVARQLATSYEVEAEAFRSTLQSQLAAPSSLVLVAEQTRARQPSDTQQPKIIGYAFAHLHPTFHANGPVLWIEEILVIDQHRRTGIGHSLVTEIEKWGERSGATYVALATRRAAAFYEALGYEASATYFKRNLSATTSAGNSHRQE